MSMELIIALAVLGLGGLIGLFYVSHSIEKQRRQKALLVASLSDQGFRLQRLLDFIPAAYVSKDIRHVLLTQVQQRFNKLVELAPDNEKFTKKLESCNAQILELQNSPMQIPPPAFKSPEEANELRTLLQELSRVIENLAQNKMIPAGDAQKHMHAIHNSFIEASLNYFLQMGNTARQQKKPKLAIHHYQKAMAEMQKRNQQGTHTAQIEQIKLLIAEQQQASQQETGIPAPTQGQEQGASELDQGLNELMDEKDAWKKKYF
ncbi:MAG TPA: hypothetical protein VM553_14925 [Dongiaceae bacterium]|nr:hypothetical protein [Dongiaceae bacterium]